MHRLVGAIRCRVTPLEDVSEVGVQSSSLTCSLVGRGHICGELAWAREALHFKRVGHLNFLPKPHHGVIVAFLSKVRY